MEFKKKSRETTQHDDPGSHKDCTRPSNLEKDPKKLPFRASRALS